MLGFVERVSADGVPRDERVAVFDNDGTLWCEKPLPIQLDFILRRLREMAEADPSLREKQPWQAAYDRDYAWLGKAVEEHSERRVGHIESVRVRLDEQVDGGHVISCQLPHERAGRAGRTGRTRRWWR